MIIKYFLKYNLFRHKPDIQQEELELNLEKIYLDAKKNLRDQMGLYKSFILSV